jgi:ATP-dependent RNA helicase DeaD
VAVESLAQEHDLMNIALAAMKLAHQKEGGDQEEDEQEEDFRPPMRGGRDDRRGGERPEPRGAYRDDARGGQRGESRGGDRGEGRSEVRGADRGEGRRASAGPMARVYVGAGRKWGIRPQDLVGAIAGESGIQGNQIGAIEISDKYSIVELPEAVLEQVVQAMKKSVIKGRKAVVRRFVEKS